MKTQAVVATIGFWLLLAPHIHAQSFEDTFVIESELTLEEQDEAILVVPFVSVSSEGNFLIADGKEGRAHVYTPSGSLERSVGQRGQGPGEFMTPTEIETLQDGRILVGELMFGHLSVFSERWEFEQRHSRILRTLAEVHQLDNGEVVLAGPKSGGPGASALLHFVDVSTGEIHQSFFPHPTPVGTYGNVMNGMADIVAADVRGNQVVSMLSPEPVLYWFDAQGQATKTVEISLSNFRPLAEQATDNLSNQDIRDMATKYSTVQDLFWVSDNVVIVQYSDVIDRRTNTLRWNLAAVTTDGTVLFDLADTPKLHAVDEKTGTFFFSNPKTLAPNEWLKAKMKNGL